MEERGKEGAEERGKERMEEKGYDERVKNLVLPVGVEERVSGRVGDTEDERGKEKR